MSQQLAVRERLVSEDRAVPVLDTAKFDHMARIATTIASSALVPKHLVASGNDAFKMTQANVFRVVNQAIRWGFDPFAVVDSTYVVQGKLGYEGKLVAAVVNARSGLKGRLRYTYNNLTGDGLEITVTGQFMDEDFDRVVTLKVGDAKTTNGMWTKDPRQKLIYSGATKWARAHCPEVILGVMTDDDLERIQASAATNVTPNHLHELHKAASAAISAPAPPEEAEAADSIPPAEEDQSQIPATDWPAYIAAVKADFAKHKNLKALTADRDDVRERLANEDAPEEVVQQITTAFLEASRELQR